MSKKGFANIVLTIVGVLVVIGGGYYIFIYRGIGGLVACTKEAKVCPDGTIVDRTGPNCKFAECPSTEVDGK